MSQYPFFTPQKSIAPGLGLSFTTSNFSPICDLDDSFAMPIATDEPSLPGWYLPNDPRAISENSNSTGFSNKLSLMSSATSSATATSNEVLQENFAIRFSQLKNLERCKNELIEVSKNAHNGEPVSHVRRSCYMKMNISNRNSPA